MKEKEWYKISVHEIFDELKTSVDGLSMKEALRRQDKFGKNIIPRRKNKSVFSIFLGEFFEPITIVLLIAVVLSFVTGEVIDAFAILFIILVDVIISTCEEYKATKSAETLQQLIKVDAKVIRDSKELIVDSSNLVVGDIIVLEPGSKIPADARIIESKNLTIDESSLTGESVAVLKNKTTLKRICPIYKRSNMVYASTSVLTGRALGVVTAIASNTEIGHIANEINNLKEEKSPLTIRMEKFSKQISLFIVIISFIIMFILKSKGFPNSEIFLSVIALIVSAMPEGMPLALTLALSIATNRMYKKNVIVKRLNAVESLGSCTVIASDKTGTLTVNEQTAKKILLPDDSIFNISGSGYNDNGTIKSSESLEKISLLVESGCINNEATLEKKNNKWIKTGDMIDVAFLALGLKYKMDINNLSKVDFVPYECENKYSAVKYIKNGKTYCSVKGSTEVILSFCDKMIVNGKKVNIDKEKISRQNEQLAREGYRVIALATSKVKSSYDIENISSLDFLGLVAFIDPIREDAVWSIRKCKNAGIKVVMITGDHPHTSFKIAKELEIAEYFNDVATGDDIDYYLKKGKNTFDNFVRNKTVFSRITPIQKLKIVESYKRQGEFIAVTGDGVNDAPALKCANVGISMGSGCDVAKDNSDMILINDDFSSIVNGIEEGRVAYSNIRKICYLLISCGISEVLFFMLSIMCNMKTPLVAIQLLWINVVTDGLQDISLSFETGEDGIMTKPPRPVGESLFDKNLILEVLISGLFCAFLIFFCWYYLINIRNCNIVIARGYILTLMVFIQNLHVLNCMSEEKSIFKISLKKNPFIIFSILISIILHVLFMRIPILSRILQTEPISFNNLLGLFIIVIPILIVMELYKTIRFYRSK